MIARHRLRRGGRRPIVSVCTLYSGALFVVPSVLLALHGYLVLSVCASLVCAFSLVFHRECIGTTWRCNPIVRRLDIANSTLGWAAVMAYGRHDPWTVALMWGVPAFFAAEHAAIARGQFHGHLWGPAGLHSLCHLSAVVANVRLAVSAEGVTELDLFWIVTSSVAAVVLAALFEPEFFLPPGSPEERRRAWAGLAAP